MNRLRVILAILLVCFSYNALAHDNTETILNDTAVVASDTVSVADATIYKKETDSLRCVISKLAADTLELKKINAKLYQRLLFADSCFLRVSNDCLRQKYDSMRVNKAIENFGIMYSPQLQKTFAPLKSLLENYDRYYREIHDLLAKIENDKGMTNVFTGQNAIKKNIEEIKSTDYYKKAYSANWTIMYLDDVIDKAIVRLKTFNPKLHKPLILTDLFK